jgi:hypothetical protein
MAIDPRALGKPPPTRMVFALDEKMMNLRKGVAVEVGNRVECHCVRGVSSRAENGSHTENSRFFAR